MDLAPGLARPKAARLLSHPSIWGAWVLVTASVPRPRHHSRGPLQVEVQEGQLASRQSLLGPRRPPNPQRLRVMRSSAPHRPCERLKVARRMAASSRPTVATKHPPPERASSHLRWRDCAGRDSTASSGRGCPRTSAGYVVPRHLAIERHP